VLEVVVVVPSGVVVVVVVVVVEIVVEVVPGDVGGGACRYGACASACEGLVTVRGR
jgi:hypothetical protein